MLFSVIALRYSIGQLSLTMLTLLVSDKATTVVVNIYVKRPTLVLYSMVILKQCVQQFFIKQCVQQFFRPNEQKIVHKWGRKQEWWCLWGFEVKLGHLKVWSNGSFDLVAVIGVNV